VYVRKGLPLEVIAEYDTWRKVRDWQGTQGWVHQSMLARRRTVVVVGETRTLRADADAESPAVARAEAHVVARLERCPDGIAWCEVEAEGFSGWLGRTEIWGLHRNEVVE
jgi:SH3-like domain-containing protein